MKFLKIYAGEKVSKIQGLYEPEQTELDFGIDENTTAEQIWQALAEELHIEGEKNVIDFQDCDDSSLANMLKDLENKKFIDYEILN